MIKRFVLPLYLLFVPLGCQSSTPPKVRPDIDQALIEEVAPQAGPEELIEEGRSWLDLRQPATAQPLFERALELAPSSFDARLWLLRSWMDQGHSNRTLDAIDELRRAGHEGPEMDYLYGMAFLRRAQNMLAAGVTDSSPRMNFEDAAFRLERALEVYPKAYPDAYQGIAIAAWFNLDLERARWAAELAVELSPKSARSWLQLGRVAMSQFSASRSEQTDQEWSADTRAHHARATHAFGQAILVLGSPIANADEQRLLADAGIQLGHAHIWNGDQERAMQAYALGMAWSPEAVNYGQIQGLLAPAGGSAQRADLFRRALERGAAEFQASFGRQDARAASLLWWLGWERLKAGQAVGSELAFQDSLDKNPGSVNSWFYLALARFQAHNFGGGAEAIAQGWKADSNVIIDSVLADKDSNLWTLAQALGQLVEAAQKPTVDRNRQAAMLARVISEADPYDGWNWNNLGMFTRDQADAMVYGGSKLKGDPELVQLYENSYKAYLRAIALLPDDPGIVNDTAVLLHYYLERDPELALEMYKRATQLAEAALLEQELSKTERKRLETALRDSIENHRLLEAAQALKAGETDSAPNEGAQLLELEQPRSELLAHG